MVFKVTLIDSTDMTIQNSLVNLPWSYNPIHLDLSITLYLQYLFYFSIIKMINPFKYLVSKDYVYAEILQSSYECLI